MINLDQSIAKVKGEILGGDFTRDELVEAIMHEGAGRDRVTLLEWLNAQVDAFEVQPVEGGGELPRFEPVYRPEKRGGVWCLYDVNNNELRQETFDNKGEATVYAERLEAGEDLDEPYFHVSKV